MDLDTVTLIMNEAIQIILLTSLPTVGLGLIVGVVVALIQAVTQVQEQTLTFVPKLVAVLLVLAATFGWMFRIMMELTLSLWNNIPTFSQ